MEQRYILAAMLIAAIVTVAVWFLTKKARERRRFRLRQQGRGKPMKQIPAE
jgi:hypothetical protein